MCALNGVKLFSVLSHKQLQMDFLSVLLYKPSPMLVSSACLACETLRIPFSRKLI